MAKNESRKFPKERNPHGGGRKRGSNRNRATQYNSIKKEGASSVPVYTGSTDNDPTWYVPNGQLIKDVASIPMVLRSGAPIDLNPYPPSYFNWNSQPMFVPGIMTMYTMPMFGTGTDNYDALNTAANAFFVELRRATSGTSYYEDVDSMLYLLAGANILSAYAFAVRIYGLINYYRMENSYTPKALVESMGVNYEDISTHMADFRASLNQFAYRLQSVVLPKVTDYITRAVFMYENVYMDAESNKAQYYLYSPAGFYQYSEGGDSPETATGRLTFKPLMKWSKMGESGTVTVSAIPSRGALTHNNIISMLNDLLDPILESQDMGYIMADVLKAYGGSNMYSVTPIAETYSNPPVYNREVLMQMENAHVYDYKYVSAGVVQDIRINSSTLQPYFGAATGSPMSSVNGKNQTREFWMYPTLQDYFNDVNIPLNFHFNDVTPDNIMVASRLSGAGSTLIKLSDNPNISSGDLGYSASGAETALKPIMNGSDIVVGAHISYYNSLLNSGKQQASSIAIPTKYNLAEQITSATEGIPSEALTKFALTLQLLATFDWHPRVDTLTLTYVSDLTYTPVPNGVGAYVKDPQNGFYPNMLSTGIWDLENYTTITQAELSRIHDIAMWGLFTSKLNTVR